jgi:predicted MFS family arabinose efflux permease
MNASAERSEPIGKARKGTFTFRTAAALFLISGLLELFSVTSAVPLFGALRDGAIAMSYHLTYTALFLGLGIGLWTAKRWGYQLVFAATAVYTIDKVQSVLDQKSMNVELTQLSAGYDELWQVVDKAAVMQVLTIMVLMFVVCWWGFAIYTYLRRGYFGIHQASDAARSPN